MCVWEAGLGCAGHRGAAVSPTSQTPGPGRARAGGRGPLAETAESGNCGAGTPTLQALFPAWRGASRSPPHSSASLAQALSRPGLPKPCKTLWVGPQRSPASPAGRLPCHPSCQNSQEAGARTWTLACLTSKAHLCPELLPKAF